MKNFVLGSLFCLSLGMCPIIGYSEEVACLVNVEYDNASIRITQSASSQKKARTKAIQSGCTKICGNTQDAGCIKACTDKSKHLKCLNEVSEKKNAVQKDEYVLKSHSSSDLIGKKERKRSAKGLLLSTWVGSSDRELTQKSRKRHELLLNTKSKNKKLLLTLPPRKSPLLYK